MTRQDCYELGKILKTHSFKGEYLISFNNRFEDTLENSESIFVEVDGLLVPFFFETIQIATHTTAIIKFDTIHDEDKSLEFVGCNLYIPKKNNKANKNTEKHDLINYSISDKTLGDIGIITEIVEIPQNNLYKVINGKKEYLIPVNDNFILKINHKSDTVFTDLPEGLIEIND